MTNNTIGKLKRKAAELRDFMPMLLFMVAYLLIFSLLEKRTVTHYTEIHLWLDDRIPFVSAFVIPYYLWFLYVAATVLYLYFADRKNYDRTATLLYIGMSAFLIISYLFPNIQYLRPRVMPDQSIFTQLVFRIYQADTSTNIFPSIHVFNSLCCMAGLSRSPAKRPVRIASSVLGVSVILSTMFIKQHSVIDVIGAVLMFVPLYMMVFNYDLVIMSRRRRALANR